MTAAQAASIQARVTVLAPQEQPSVRVVPPGPESDASAAVVVAGVQAWGVRVQIGEEEFVMSHRPTAAGRIELSPVAWASAIGPSEVERSPVRLILAAN